MKIIFVKKTKILIYIWLTMPNLDTGALTSSLEQLIQNNQWIYYLIPLDTYCEETIGQGGHKP